MGDASNESSNATAIRPSVLLGFLDSASCKRVAKASPSLAESEIEVSLPTYQNPPLNSSISQVFVKRAVRSHWLEKGPKI